MTRPNRLDPTARFDMQGELLRRWYEQNRESAWERYWRNTDRADGFALGALSEARRILQLSDDQLRREFQS